MNGDNHPNNPYKPDFTKGDYLLEYQSFIDSIGIAHENAGNDVSPLEWKSGNCFWALDTSGDQCNSFHTHRGKSGQLGIHVAFKEPLAKAVTVLVYQTYHSVVKVDSDYNVIVDQLA